MDKALPEAERNGGERVAVTEQPKPVEERIGEMGYADFLSERGRIVDARQRAQQRFDQIVSTGAAAALVFSVTFIEKLAPHPGPRTRAVLIWAWCLLLVSLGCNFASHIFSQRAFNIYLREFDKSYCDNTPCRHESGSSSASKWLDISSAATFVAGVLMLALFSISNLNFESTNETGTNSASRTPQTPSGATQAAPAPTSPGTGAKESTATPSR